MQGRVGRPLLGVQLVGTCMKLRSLVALPSSTMRCWWAKAIPTATFELRGTDVFYLLQALGVAMPATADTGFLHLFKHHSTGFGAHSKHSSWQAHQGDSAWPVDAASLHIINQHVAGHG